MRTASSAATWVRWYSQALYRDRVVVLTTSEFTACVHERVEPMHHVDAKGRHYCPTGYVWCPWCGGTGSEPRPFACERWEQPWWDRALAYLRVLVD